MNLYHVSHTKYPFTPGEVIELRPLTVASDIQDQALWEAEAENLNRQFPNGFSQWGAVIFSNADDKGIFDREYYCEMIRRLEYPSRPSRYQSFFAVDSVDSAKSFRIGAKTLDASIWEVQPQGKVFKADMNLLRDGKHSDETLRRYWRGECRDHADPLWEYLLVPPVRVVRRIEERE